MDMKVMVSADSNLAETAVWNKEKSFAFRFIKRAGDVIASVMGLAILSPVFLITALAIKLDDGGAVIHKRYCIGKDEKTYVMYKFRTMYENADCMMGMFSESQMKQYLQGEKFENDPRITRIGKVLRKTSIDELPQLFSVLKGDMSLVGPRPVIEREADAYGRDREKLLSVKAGITGIWQIYGRGRVAYLSREAMDMQLRYVDESSVRTDIKILWRTVGVVLLGKGAK